MVKLSQGTVDDDKLTAFPDKDRCPHCGNNVRIETRCPICHTYIRIPDGFIFTPLQKSSGPSSQPCLDLSLV